MTGELVQPLGSSDKVRMAIDRAEAFADDPQAPTMVRMVAGSLTMMRGQLEAMLPSTDAELDELLDKGARWFESMKSDPRLTDG